MLIVGSELLQRPDGGALLSAATRIADTASGAPPTEEWRVLNILQKVCVWGVGGGEAEGGGGAVLREGGWRGVRAEGGREGGGGGVLREGG